MKGLFLYNPIWQTKGIHIGNTNSKIFSACCTTDVCSFHISFSTHKIHSARIHGDHLRTHPSLLFSRKRRCCSQKLLTQRPSVNIHLTYKIVHKMSKCAAAGWSKHKTIALKSKKMRPRLPFWAGCEYGKVQAFLLSTCQLRLPRPFPLQSKTDRLVNCHLHQEHKHYDYWRNH